MASTQTAQRREEYVERSRAAEEKAPATLHDRFIGGCIGAGAAAVVLAATIMSPRRSLEIAGIAFLVLVGIGVYRFIRGGAKNFFRPTAVDGTIAGIWLGAFFNMIGGVHIFGVLNLFALVGRIVVLVVFSLIAGGLAWLLRRRGSPKAG